MWEDGEQPFRPLHYSVDPTVRVEPAGTISQHMLITGEMSLHVYSPIPQQQFLSLFFFHHKQPEVLSEYHRCSRQNSLAPSPVKYASRSVSHLLCGRTLLNTQGGDKNVRQWHTVYIVKHPWCSSVVTQHNPTHRVTCLQHGPWKEDAWSCFEFFQRFGWLAIYLS